MSCVCFEVEARLMPGHTLLGYCFVVATERVCSFCLECIIVSSFFHRMAGDLYTRASFSSMHSLSRYYTCRSDVVLPLSSAKTILCMILVTACLIVHLFAFNSHSHRFSTLQQVSPMRREHTRDGMCEPFEKRPSSQKNSRILHQDCVRKLSSPCCD